MKKYAIPLQWVQRGLIAIEGDDLKDAVDKAEALDFGTLNVVGQTAPESTMVVYNGLRQYTADEQLSDEVVLYTSSKVPNCPFCEKAKEWFKANNIEYKLVDIMLDRDAAEHAFKRTRSMAMPQVEIGNEILIGFIEADVTRVAQAYGLIEAPTPPAPTPNIPDAPVKKVTNVPPEAEEIQEPAEPAKPSAKKVEAEADAK
tara:strand:+ start:1716 stop:2318 length:603 start_codon:yes stop_codon:yes gene_type:complete